MNHDYDVRGGGYLAAVVRWISNRKAFFAALLRTRTQFRIQLRSQETTACSVQGTDLSFKASDISLSETFDAIQRSETNELNPRHFGDVSPSSRRRASFGTTLASDTWLTCETPMGDGDSQVECGR